MQNMPMLTFAQLQSYYFLTDPLLRGISSP